MNRLARRRDANLLPRGLDSSSQLHQFILSCCMLFTIHCGHRPPHIRREGPTINPVLFERDDPSDLVDVTVARRHSSEREREGAKIRKAKYLTQLFTKWSIFVCNCEAVTCYLFYNGRVARGPDPTKKITHVPETFRAEQSRGAICFASPWITLLPNPNPMEQPQQCCFRPRSAIPISELNFCRCTTLLHAERRHASDELPYERHSVRRLGLECGDYLLLVGDDGHRHK